MTDETRKKLKIVKLVAWCLLGVILAFILIAVATLLVKKYIKKDPVPMFMGVSTMVVITGSMSGTIEKGDLIIVTKAKEYKLTDIVTYIEKDSNVVVTHRLVNYGEEEGTFIAKGDANNTTDIYPVSVDQIVGKVTGHIPKLGLVFDWIVQEGGVIYIVSLILIIGVGVFFYRLVSSDSEKAEESASGAPDTNVGNAENSSEIPVQTSEDSPQDDNKQS